MAAFPKIHRVVESVCAAIERHAVGPLIRGRQPSCIYDVEALEERRLLSRFNITWGEWEHSSPAFLAEIAALEQQYPRFAVLLNQDLAALRVDSSSGSAVAAESAVLRGPLHHPRSHRVHPTHVKPAHRPKPPRHPKPAHNTKPHHPKPHRHGSSVTEALSPSGGPSVTANNFVYDPSLPHQLIFTFNEDVSGSLSSAGMSAISVIDLNTGSSVTPSSYTWTSGTKTATYGFSSALPDGNYAAVLHGSLIYDSSNVHLIGSDTINGHDYLASSTSDNGLFWFKDPDPNRDRSVGNDDASLIAAHYNMAGGYKQGDVDYSGTVNFNDLVIVDRAFGQSLPQLGAPGTPTLTAAGTDRLLISWPASTDTTVTGYDVYRNWQRVATNVTTTSYLDEGLSANTSYTYSVVAKNSSGNTSFATIPLVASTTSVGALSVQPILDQLLTEGDTRGVSTTFSDAGPTATHSVTINWGDGNAGPATVEEVNNTGDIFGSHQYGAAGTYYAILTVQSSAGGSATTVFQANVADATPVFSASGAPTFVESQPYSLTATFSDVDTTNGWSIAWGDGSTGSQGTGNIPATLTHIYSGGPNAPYTLTATVTTDDGTYTNIPTVDEAQPTLSVTGAGQVAEGATYTLADSFTDPGGDAVTGLQVDWGDGQSYSVTGNPGSLTHVYTDPPPGGGSYTIAANATTEDGSYWASPATVGVTEAAPTVSLTGPSSATEGASIALTGTFSDPGGDNVYDWSLSWGDGKNSFYDGSPTSFVHTFPEAGNFTVTATAATEDGTYTTTRPANIADAPSTLGFSTNGTLSAGGVCLLNDALSDPGSHDTPSQWTVVWGDGASDSFGTNPDYQGAFTHTYTEPSSGSGYSITVTATTDDGTYTATGTQPVVEAASTLNVSGLRGAVAGQAYTLQAFFTDPAGDPASSYFVDWNDGTTQTYSSPILTHVYPYPNEVFTPTVTVATDDSTAAAAAALGLYVDSPGGAGNMTQSATSPIAEGAATTLTANFSDITQTTNGYPAGAQWTICWGDGSIDGFGGPVSSISLQHTYAEAGTYLATIGAEYQDNNVTATYEVKQTRTIVATEVTPTLSVSGPPSVYEGSPYTVTAALTDAGSRDVPQKWTVAWGDGSTQVNWGSAMTHYYTTAPAGGTTYTINISAVIDDGTYSASLPVSIILPSVSVAAQNGVAHEQGQQPDQFVITRSNASTLSPLTVNYTLGGTEDASEYVVSDASTGQILTGSVTIPVGSTFAKIQITPLETGAPEWTDTVIATLTSSQNYTVNPSGSTATIQIVNDDLGVYLGNGSGNLVLQGSSSGAQNLVPLALTFPQDMKTGATLTLTDSQPTEADVWLTSTPGSSDQPVVGMVNGSAVASKTWTYGTDALPPTTLWVGGTGGSQTAGDILLTLADSDANATPPPPSNAATTNSATTKGATDVGLQIILMSDPNHSGKQGKDVSGNSNSPLPWLIGQMVDVQAQLSGPQGMVKHATYQWATPPGNIARLWTPKTPPVLSPVSNDDGGGVAGLNPGHHTGYKQGRLDFFWLSTTAAPPAFDTDSVNVTVTSDGKQFAAATSFNVYPPTSTVNVDQGTPDVYSYNGGQRIVVGLLNANSTWGIRWTATVTTPAGVGFALHSGEYNFLQTVKLSRKITTQDGDIINSNFAGQWVLDNQNPYPPFKDLNTIDWFNTADGMAWKTDNTNGDWTADGPQDFITLKTKQDEFDTEEYKTHLMYLPPSGTAPSQWVPLKMEDWSFAVSATVTVVNGAFGNVSLTPGFTPQKNIPAFAPQSTEPTWVDVELNGIGPKNVYPR